MYVNLQYNKFHWTRSSGAERSDATSDRSEVQIINMWFVYIIKSTINNTYYIGSTDNIERRLDEHNRGKSKYTRTLRPFVLMFKQEFATLSEARSVEYKIKKFKSRKIIEKIILEKRIRFMDK